MYKAYRLQNKVATSNLLLPFVYIFALIVMLLSGDFSRESIMRYALVGVTTLIMMLLNSKYMLIRVYSRVVSSTYLLLSLLLLQITQSSDIFISQFVTALTLIFLLSSFQHNNQQSQHYYASLCLGILTLFCPKIIYAIPLLLIVAKINMANIGSRHILATIFGILTPYWLYLPYTISHGKTLAFYTQIINTLPLTNLQTSQEWHTLIANNTHLYYYAILILLLYVISALHFFSTSYADKVQTRMIYNTLITTFLIFAPLYVLSPASSEVIAGMLIVLVAPVIGHYFTFSNSVLSNLTFIIVSIFVFLSILMLAITK